MKSNQYINIKEKKGKKVNTAELWSYHYCCPLPAEEKRLRERKILVQGHIGSVGGKIWIWVQLDPGILFFSSRIQVLAMFTNLNGDLEPDWSLRMGLHSRWDLNRLPLHQSHWYRCLPTLTQKMYNVKINAMCMSNYRVGWGLEIKKRNGSSQIRLTGRRANLLFLPWKVYKWKQGYRCHLNQQWWGFPRQSSG